MHVGEPLQEYRNPLGTETERVQAALGPRAGDLAEKSVWLIRSWAQFSGMEPLLDAIEQRLRARYPGVRVRQVAKPTAYAVNDTAFFAQVAAEADAFVYAGAFSASTTHYAVHYAGALETLGRPGVVIAYDTLTEDARNSAQTAAVPVRWVPAPYPLDGAPGNALAALADRAIDQLGAPLTDAESAPRTTARPARARVFRVSEEAVQDHYHDLGMTDGLPIVAPTAKRVDAMLATTSVPPETVLCPAFGPEGWEVCVEQAAVNAVMAGCPPAAFPVVLAALEAFAMGVPGNPSSFVTHMRSTSNFACMQLVNGPIAQEIGMNGGLNALGPGNRANASIGRALRLAVINLGGGRLGVNMMPVIGNAAGYTFAFAENEAASPWPALAADRGFGPQESVLTLFGGGWAHTGNYLDGGLDKLAADAAMFEFPNGLAVLISPPRARALQAEGWTKAAIEEHVWRHAQGALKDFRASVYWPTIVEPNLRSADDVRLWPSSFLTDPDELRVPLYPRSKVKVIVVGGEVSPMMQAWKTQMGPSVSIDRWR